MANIYSDINFHIYIGKIKYILKTWLNRLDRVDPWLKDFSGLSCLPIRFLKHWFLVIPKMMGLFKLQKGPNFYLSWPVHHSYMICFDYACYCTWMHKNKTGYLKWRENKTGAANNLTDWSSWTKNIQKFVVPWI